MSRGLKEQLSSLIQDAITHLRDSYEDGSWVVSNSADYTYFRHLAHKVPVKDNAAPQRPAPQVSAAPPPPPTPIGAARIKRRPVARKTPTKKAEAVLPASTADTPSTDDWLLLAPLGPPRELTWGEVEALLKPIETRVRLRPTVPSDAIAQERAAHWRRQLSPATVLLFHKAEGGGELEFLTNVAHSIDGCLCPCILSDTTPEGITSEPSCRLLVLSEASLAQTPALQAALKEGQPSRIGPNPVLILPAIHQYFEHPELKASLWTSLCHLLEGKS